MIAKNCGGKVPEPEGKLDISMAGEIGCLITSRELIGHVRECIDRQAFHEALEEIWKVVRDANRFVDDKAPWALKKTDPEMMGAVLYVLAETIRHITIILQPFMPDSCARVLDQLSVPTDKRRFEHLSSPEQFKDDNALVPGTPLPNPEGIFPRYAGEDAEAAS